MSYVVTNSGQWVRDSGGNKTTDFTRAQSDAGTVRVVYEGIEYVFGPGQSKAFSDNGVATAVAAADGRLRLADTREGFASKGRS